MISYETIDCSGGIVFDKGKDSIKCMNSNYFYFKDIGFKYQQYVCNSYHDFSMGVQNLSDFCVVTIKNVDYRVYIANLDKKAAVFILKSSYLSNKGVL